MKKFEPYQIALKHAGLKEIKGKEDNPVIIQMFYDIGYNGHSLKDETSWCSLFVCWCCKVAGYQHTGKLYARSFAEFDGVIKIEDEKDVQLGDIVVFWRGSHDGDLIPGSNIAKGHVAFFMNFDQDERYVNVLGGNQGNMVQISKYYKNRVIGYYRPLLNPSI